MRMAPWCCLDTSTEMRSSAVPITNANTNDVLDDVVPDDDGAGPFCSWSESVCVMPVSYTHLTLPTICSV